MRRSDSIIGSVWNRPTRLTKEALRAGWALDLRRVKPEFLRRGSKLCPSESGWIAMMLHRNLHLF